MATIVAELSGGPRRRSGGILVLVTAIKLDGKLTRDEIVADLTTRVAALRDRGVTPGLATVLVGDDPGSHSYVTMKHRDCEQIDENAVLERMDPDKDADGLHPVNLGRLVLGEPAPLPCTPRGCIHLLRRFDVPLDGAHVVVVGRGITVGRPLGLMLTRRSENSTVTLCHTGTRDLAAETRRADVVVAAAGVAHMLTPDMVAPGVAVLDVGVSRVDGKLAGDVHPDVWEVAGAVSPNPGGVGPLTRAFLMTNVVERAERLAGL